MRRRLVARDYKPRHEELRHDLYAAMLALQATKALYAYVMELMFVDEKGNKSVSNYPNSCVDVESTPV